MEKRLLSVAQRLNTFRPTKFYHRCKRLYIFKKTGFLAGSDADAIHLSAGGPFFKLVDSFKNFRESKIQDRDCGVTCRAAHVNASTKK